MFELRGRVAIAVGGVILACASIAVLAQANAPARLAILLAEERRAPAAADVATLRTGMRNADIDTALLAIRAVGRLQRPALVADLTPALVFARSELRAEAAHAVAASFDGLRTSSSLPARIPAVTASIGAAFRLLATRIAAEREVSVRAALAESIGRLPYSDRAQVQQAAQALADAASRYTTVTDRLGIAKGFNALIRTNATDATSDSALAILEHMAALSEATPRLTSARGDETNRDARVRRLALDALLSAPLESDPLMSIVARAAEVADPDVQMRRLTVLAASRLQGLSSSPVPARVLEAALRDPAPMVRAAAVRSLPAYDRSSVAVCARALAAADDDNLHVSLAAIDLLDSCSGDTDASGARAWLERMTADRAAAERPRNWHRAAHALVAFAHAFPDTAAGTIEQFAQSTVVALRAYAARAAEIVQDRGASASSSAGTRSTSALPAAPASRQVPTVLTVADLRRYAAPRARITIRDLGIVDVALFTSEAPAAVLRFVRLVESGYFNGMAIEPAVSGLAIETHAAGEPRPDAQFPRDEPGAWPHVRGALGLITDAPGGEGRIFIDLVDNPQFDHRYTVFGQILDGLDVVDEVIEGDVIERVEMLT